MDDMRSTIKISFSFMGDYFDLDDVTQKMQITPTRVREKKDCPVQSYAYTCWSIKEYIEDCDAISKPFSKLIETLKGKEVIINEICKENGLYTHFEIAIHVEDFAPPEIVLPKEIVSFAATINAEIGFDIYNDL